MRRLRLSPRSERRRQCAFVAGALAKSWDTQADCRECDRRLFRAQPQSRPRLIFDTTASLPEDDFCRWCARPISAAGARLMPLTGFLEWLRDRLDFGRRPARRHAQERAAEMPS